MNNLSDNNLQAIIETAVNTAITKVVDLLEGKGLLTTQPKKEQSAYQKTEALLYNYMGFKKIVAEHMQEIEELRVHGVPQKCGGVTERVQTSPVQTGIVLPEESVEIAVANVQRSVERTVQALAMIDKGMAALSHDPYFKVLEMRYFEGRTQEDIAVFFKCSDVTVGKNRTRLVKELSMRLFPDQAISEMMQ